MQSNFCPSLSDSPQDVIVRGTVSVLFSKNEENGWCAFLMADQDGKEWSVVGHAPMIDVNEHLEVVGPLGWNGKYNREQIKAQRIDLCPPTTLEGIEKYLASGIIPGIGPSLAKRMVAFGGERIFSIIETEPDTLLKVPGIGKKKMAQAVENCRERQEQKRAISFLYSYGLSASQAASVFRKWGTQTISIVRTTPYRMVREISGIGFETADAFALRMGVVPFSQERRQQGIFYALEVAAQTKGHCSLPRPNLETFAAKVLKLDKALFITPIVDDLLVEGRLIEEEGLVFHPMFRAAEVAVAEKLTALVKAALPRWLPEAPEKEIAGVAASHKVTLSESQRRALRTMLSSKVSVLTGGPGVGKSFLVSMFLDILDKKTAKIAICAPTGRAATRINEMTDLCEAKTIHRTLGFVPGQGFTHNADNPLDADVVILDESSMVDLFLFRALVEAIPSHALFLIVGDKDQLPSIGAGSVLNDIIVSEAVPVSRLTEIQRQSLDSLIVTNAHAINRGETPLCPSFDQDTDFYFIPTRDDAALQTQLVRIISERIPARFGFNPREILLVVPTNIGPIGTVNLNQMLQQRLNPTPAKKLIHKDICFGLGDRVIVVKNNYDLECFNGQMGFIEEIDEKERKLHLNIDGQTVVYEKDALNELKLGYATTIHKAQGSEAPCVVSAFSRSSQHMLTRSLVFTGITRAKRLFVGMGDFSALTRAIHNTLGHGRHTLLSQRLREAAA